MILTAWFLWLTALANGALGIIVFTRNTRSRQFLGYLFLALAIALWVFMNGLFQFATDSGTVYLSALLSYAAAALIAMLFVVFNLIFSGHRLGRRGALLIALGLGVALVSMLPGVLATGVTNQKAILTTPLLGVFALFLVGYFGLGFVVLVRSLSGAAGRYRTQLQLMLAGMALAVLGGVACNLILPLIGRYEFVAAGPLFTLGYLLVVGYAIARHRLFDIRRLIARSLAYLLLLGSITIVYTAALALLTSLIFQRRAVEPAQSIAYTALALFLALTFQPLRKFFEQITDRIFFRNRYSSQLVLAAFSTVLVHELELGQLLKRSLARICGDLSIGYAQLIVFNEGRVFRVEHFGPLPDRLLVAPQLKLLNKAVIVADELEGGERKRLLEQHGLRLSAMLRTREEVIGYLLLGDKLSGDIYLSQDIEVIGIMAKELAVAISNAKAYAEISEFAATLQGRINHATGRLRVANRHLKELDRVKDEFISMASHQLRTPLTTTKGYLSMLLEGDAGKLSKLQREFTEYAFDGSERMVQLISDLLDVSRLSAGRFIIDAKPTDVVAMMRDEVRRLQRHADTKGIELTLKTPTELPLIMLDENKTRQVVMNFIDNAIYYTPKGSVKVTLSLKAGWLHLEVKDTGIGVPKAARPHLFTKFYRAANAQDIRPDGTGLGLFLAKQVIEDQGGTISFSSTEGKGSTFGFDLPLVPVAQPVMQGNESHV